VKVNETNLHNAALSQLVSPEEKADPAFLATPQYWVPAANVDLPVGLEWCIAFRDIARATDVRTMIAAAIARAGAGNKLPLLLPVDSSLYHQAACTIVGNLNSTVLDFVARAKIHSTSANWYIVEQLPVVPLSRYKEQSFGDKTAGEIIKEAVLELTYTAHDMAPFARDMGYVDERGEVRPPFKWDEDRRLRLRAKLDAIYFHLYGVTNRDDVRYVYSTFPIVERQETEKYGRYLSRDLCLAWMSALAAGDPDAQIEV
jgi:hypothetical protein